MDVRDPTTWPMLWPITWLSPERALTLTTLLLFTLVQGATGALLWLSLMEKAPATSELRVRWRRTVLGVVFPLAVVWMAVRWLGTPVAAVPLESSIWPAWLGLAVGMLLLILASTGLVARLVRRAWDLSGWLAPTGGILAVLSWSLIVSFRLDPGCWLDRRTVQLALQPPPLPWIALVFLAGIVSLGAALALHANTHEHRLARSLAVISSAVGCATIVSAPWWLSENVMPQSAHTWVEQGASGPAWSARWTIVALFGWSAFGLAAHLTSRASRARIVLLLAALAVMSSQALWESYRGPWNVRGWRYKNGVEITSARVDRRSPTLPAVQPSQLGARVFGLQCATCHAQAGPLATWRRRLGCDREKIRQRLEALREADRVGHPDRERMPPLVGSDGEVDALAAWVRSTGRCP